VELKGRFMFEILAAHAALRPERRALTPVRGGPPYSYAEYAMAVCSAARELVRMGVSPDAVVLLWLDNRPEWPILDLAIQLAGAVSSALPPFCSDVALRAFVDLTDPSLVLADSPGRIERSRALGLRVLDMAVGSMAEALAQPRGELSSAVHALRDAGGRTRDDKLAYIAASSGTTEGIKGCRISFGNARLYGRKVAPLVGLDAKSAAFSFLPLAQTRLQDEYLPLFASAEVLFSATDDRVYEDVRQAKATLVASPPFFFSEIAKRFQTASGGAGDLASWLGGATSLYTGTTPVDPQLLEFYDRHGSPLYEVYGMTEACSMATMNHPGAARHGTQGRVLSGVSLTLADDGEIFIAGPNVCDGYYRAAEATEHTFARGILRTGDLGEFDADGYLRLIGRKKEIVQLTTGQKIFPKRIEDAFRRVSAVEYAVLVGTGHARAGVLVSLKRDAIASPEVIGELERALFYVNTEVDPESRLCGYRVAAPRFSIDGGEVTTSFKTRRGMVETLHRMTIQSLCA
jgi:long-chain acyl-CoA synthetase